MIKLEHVVLASPEQMKFIIEGMRNPMNSWEKSDSRTCRQDGAFCMECEHKNNYCLGENDHSLMQRLSNAGTDHRKFMRMLPVYVRITAPLYWWKEFDTSLHAVQGVSYSHFDRVVYHLHSLEQLYSIKRENCSIVRIVFVVTEDFTEDMINRIAVFCANSEDIDELSFRQMVDNHYRETYYCHDYLKAGHKKLWWYIEQNDYNLYYCQNHVYTEYKNIGGDSNG